MPLSFDFDSFERDFQTACLDCIHLLSGKYNQSPFYGVAVYMDAYYGTPGFYANTEESFQRTLVQYRQKYPESYSHSDGIRDLRYNTGDWEYQSFGCPDELDKCFNSRIRPWEDLARRMLDEEHDFWFASCGRVEEIACRIAISKATVEATRLLMRTSDFLIAVSAHDEPSVASVYRPMWYEEKGTLKGFDPMAFSSYQ
jgi:uncharacterized protein DUF4303